jgi:hypothetical protein
LCSLLANYPFDLKSYNLKIETLKNYSFTLARVRKPKLADYSNKDSDMKLMNHSYHFVTELILYFKGNKQDMFYEVQLPCVLYWLITLRTLYLKFPPSISSKDSQWNSQHPVATKKIHTSSLKMKGSREEGDRSSTYKCHQCEDLGKLWRSPQWRQPHACDLRLVFGTQHASPALYTADA